MKLDKKVYLILGAILIIAILGICWMVCNLEPANTNPNGENPNGNIIKNEFNVNNLGTDSESNNQAVDLNAVLKKVKEKNVSELQGLSKSDAEAKNIYTYEFDYLEYGIAVAGNEDENEYTEIWLVKTSSKDNRIFEVMSRRANEFTPAQKSSNIVIKEESNVAILIISNIASEIEKTIDDEILNASKDNTVINVNAEGKVSETQTTKESVKVEVKVEKENIEKVEIYASEYNALGEEAVEAKYNEEKKVYEAEVKFENDSEYATYEIVGIITDKNGNKEYMYISEVMHSDRAVLNTSAIKEDGKIKVSVNALSGGEILVTSTKDKPSANNTNWQKYEADKVYEMETANDNLETVYVWYKAGNEIALANEGVQVVADGTSNILMYRNGSGSGAGATSADYIIGSDVRNETAYASSLVSTITILDNMNIPAGADSWDVSSYNNGSIMAWITDDNSDGMYDLFIGSNGKIVAESGHVLFAKYSKCTAINNLSLIDFGNTWDMYAMFTECKSLTSLDLTGLNTSSITRMLMSFWGCSSLTTIVLTGLDTSNVTDMTQMFYGCGSLTSLTLTNIDTSNVTKMSNMFFNCSKLTTLDVSGFVTNKVTDMSGMFSGCGALSTLDVSGFNTSNVTNMSSMFNACKKLSVIDVSDFDTTKVTNMSYMFLDCQSVSVLDVAKWVTNKVTDIRSMFLNCFKVKNLDVSNFNTTNVTTMSGMFQSCYALESVDLSGFNTSKVTDMNRMFRNCTALKKLDLSSFDTSKVTTAAGMEKMFAGSSILESVVLGAKFDQIDGSGMFESCPKLTQIFSHATTPMTIGDSLGVTSSNGITLWVPNTTVVPNYASAANSSIFAIKPLISLIGKDTIKLGVGATYAEEGVKVLESTDSSVYGAQGYSMSGPVITKAGSTVSSVNTSNAGEYQLTYTLNYSSNPIARAVATPVTTVTRNIEVKEVPFLMGRETESNYNAIYILGSKTRNETKYSSDTVATITLLNSIDIPNGADSWDVSEANNGSIMAWITDENSDGKYDVFIGSDVGMKLKTGHKFFNNYPNCTAINNLSLLDTSETKDMHAMFYGCTSLTSLDVSKFNTSKVTNMGYMFRRCDALTTLDLSSLDTTNVDNMEGMFFGSKNLKELDVTNFKTSNVKNMQHMFEECSGLATIKLNKSETEIFDTSNVTNMNNMFASCNALTTLDISKFNTGNVIEMSDMFCGCSSLTTLDVSKWDTSKVQDFGATFRGITHVTTLDVSNFNTSSATNMSYMFFDCSRVKKLEFTKWDTSNVTDMHNMFSYSWTLTSLDLSKFNTSKVTDMNTMFIGCTQIQTINFTGWNTSNVTNMSYMFRQCAGLSSLDLSSFDTSNATDIGSMFRECTKLTSLDLSGFNTSKATSIRKMFEGATSLKNLDLTSFDTTNVTNMDDMFLNCTGLQYVKLGAKFNQINGATMFSGCTALTQIFSHATTPMTIGDSLGVTSSNGITLWAANPTVVANYASAANSSTFTIKPLISLIGKDTVKLAVGSDYTDAGAKVLESTDSSVYTPYGYTMTASGTTVPTDTVGTKNITYTLNYTDSGKTPETKAVTTVTRNINVKELPYLMEKEEYYTPSPDGKDTWQSAKYIVGAYRASKKENKYLNYTSDLVKRVIFEDSINIPTDAPNWDVSSAENGEIMAWLTTNSEDNTMYDLHIGSDVGMKIINSARLFYHLEKCEEIKNLHLIDTSELTNMDRMFGYCYKLKSLDLSSFVTDNVIVMSYVFNNCSTLETLDLSKFNTSKVEYFTGMFSMCTNLKTLNISSFNTSSAIRMVQMFQHCESITSLDLSHFDTSKVTDMHVMFESCKKLTSLDISNFNTSNVTRITSMFGNCESLTNLDLSHFNTSNVTEMTGLVAYCYKLTNINVSSFNTSNVTNMNSMFRNCKELTTLDLSNFNTSKVTDFEYFLFECTNLTEVNVSSFNLASAQNIGSMFRNCPKLTSLDLSGFDTSTVTSFRKMFQDSTGLKNLDLTSFDTTNVTNMENMFYNCTGLEYVKLGDKFNQINGATMFSGCTNLKQIFSHATTPMTIGDSLGLAAGTTLWVPNPDVVANYSGVSNASAFGAINPIIALIGKKSIKIGVGADYIDAGAKVLESTDSSVYEAQGYSVIATGTTVDTKNPGVKNVTYTLNYSKNPRIRANPTAITSVTRTVEVKNSATMMQRDFITEDYIEGTEVGAHQFKSGNVGAEKVISFYALGAIRAEQNGVIEDKEKYTADKIATIEFININETDVPTTYADTWYVDSDENGTDIQSWVIETGTNTGMYNLIIGSYTKILANQLSNNLFRVYRNCTEIKGLSKLDTSNVTNMGYMFSGCNSLTSLDVSNFNTSNVIHMGGMFTGCNSLTSLNVSNFNTENVTQMGEMFVSCSNLTSLSVSNFNTGNVKDMNRMFDNCSKLTTLDVSNFNTSNVTNMENMFYNCLGLTTLKLNKSETEIFDTSKVTNMSRMFYNCSNLTTLDVSKFNTSNVTNMYSMFRECTKLTSLDVSEFSTGKVANMQMMFYNCSNVTDLDVSDFVTNNVTTMSEMFTGCEKVNELDVSNFNTSNVTNMYYMFQGCAAVTKLDVSNFDTSKVTKMGSMFHNCSNLQAIDLSNFDTSSVTDMNRMFRSCTSIEEVDMGSFDTAQVTSMENMFKGCSNLEKVTLGAKFDRINGADVFASCPKLTQIFSHSNTVMSISGSLGVAAGTTLWVPNPEVAGKYGSITNATVKPIITLIGKNPINVAIGSDYTDEGAKVLDSTDSAVYSPYGYSMTASGTTVPTDTTGVRSITYTLNYTDSGKTPETKAVTTVTRNINVKEVPFLMRREMEADYSTKYILGSRDRNETQYSQEAVATITFLNSIDIPNGADSWDVSEANNGSIMAWITDENSDGMYDLFIGSDVGMKLRTGHKLFANYRNCTSINNLSLLDTSETTDMWGMFANCKSLISLNLSSFDTGKVTSMGQMFTGCSSLTSIVLTGLDTSNVTNMSEMFYNCSKLTTLDLSDFKTSKVQNMYNMFYNCTSLTSLKLNKSETEIFDTSSVTNMNTMFRDCSALTSLDVSKFNTGKVETMKEMFYNCKALTELDVSKWNTGSVTNMSNMFNNCLKLTTLDLTGFDTSSVTDMNRMFRNCTGLKKLDLSNFDTSKVTTAAGMEKMFAGCTNLETLVLGSKFDKLNGSAMFEECGKLKLIFSHAETAINIGSDIGANSNMTLYVPNASVVASYADQTNASAFGAIKPIITLIGKNPINVEVDSNYTDAGATVLESTDSSVYGAYGYSITASATTVDTKATGTKSITYTLNYTDSGKTPETTVVTTIERIINLTIDISEENVKVIDLISDDLRIYTGMTHKPEVTLKYGEDVLDPSKYTVSYGKNIFGLGTITVTGNGETYLGTRTINFMISTRPITLEAGSASKEYDGSPLTCDEYKNTVGTLADGDSIEELKTIGSQTEIGSSSNVIESVVIKNSANEDVTEYYDIKTAAGTLTVTIPDSIEFGVAVENANFIYNGDEIKPKVTVSIGATVLGEDDYEVTYTNNKNVGEATITIAGKGDYQGSYGSAKFNISKRVIEVTAGSATKKYDGKALTCSDYEIIEGELADNDMLTISTNGSITTVGTTENTITSYGIFNGMNDVTSNYEVTTKTGILEVLLGTLKGSVTINGTNRALKTLTAEVTVEIEDEITDYEVIYQWFDEDGVEISVDDGIVDDDEITGEETIESGKTLVIPRELVGKRIYVKTTVSKEYYEDTVFEDATDEVNNEFAEVEDILTPILKAETYDNVYENNYIFGNAEIPQRRDDIKTIYIMDHQISPSEDAYCFDVSKKQNGSVLAWIVENGEMYDLYIGGMTEVIVSRGEFLFANYTNCVEIMGMEYLNTYEVGNMSYMFADCQELTELDVTYLDTSCVTDMSYMFARCNELSNLYVNKFDTIRVTNMKGMFKDCSQLPVLDLTMLDTVNVTDMSGMFENCSSLNTLDVSLLDTSRVTNMASMFAGCSSVETIDVSGFITENVKSVSNMFKDCISLTGVDLSNFNMKSLDGATAYLENGSDINQVGMFDGCTALRSVVVGRNVDRLDGENMFRGCDSLVSIIAQDTLAMSLGENIGISEDTVLYVQNADVESIYEEEASCLSVFGTDRIKPMLEILGNDPEYVKLFDTYVDAGALVAGFTDEWEYSKYGYTFEVEGADVDTSTEGVNKVIYTLKYLNMTIDEVQY